MRQVFQKFNQMMNSAELGASFRALTPYVWIVLTSFLIFITLILVPAVRVGDGSEYYGLYVAIKNTLRPWMSPASFSTYSDLFSSGAVSGLVAPDALANAFPALRIGVTADFNHFWLYSALAALAGAPLSAIGFDVPPHAAFLLLHCLLFIVSLLVAYKYYSIRGVLAVFVMTFASPMLWFSNKVHSEFFTYTLALTAVIFSFREKYVFAALSLALTSTQNPSFGLVALFALGARVVLQPRKTYGFMEMAAVVATVLAALAHPVYYFSRFGVLSPQFLAGGAELGGNLAKFAIWLIDPDLGLFPNWPLGAVVLIAGGILFFRKNKQPDADRFVPAGWWLSAIYLLVGLYANSSTLNLNSGATISVARYALWYIPLLFPFFVEVFEWLSKEKNRMFGSAVIVFSITVLSVVAYNPRQGESYTSPSRLSLFVQKKFPNIYNPPSEVFLERYSGLGESEASNHVLAVLGPDCKKVLFVQGNGRDIVRAPAACMLNPSALKDLLIMKGGVSRKDSYDYLSDKEISSLIFKPQKNKFYSSGDKGDGVTVLGSGWSGLEPWGVWSDGKYANISMPCSLSESENAEERVLLKMVAFTAPGRTGTTLSINAGREKIWAGVLNGEPKEVEIRLPAKACAAGVVGLELEIENPASPKSLGLSDDPRKLGIGLLGFSFI